MLKVAFVEHSVDVVGPDVSHAGIVRIEKQSKSTRLPVANEARHVLLGPPVLRLMEERNEFAQCLVHVERVDERHLQRSLGVDGIETVLYDRFGSGHVESHLLCPANMFFCRPRNGKGWEWRVPFLGPRL